jgi:trehalose-6-phosphate synthase
MNLVAKEYIASHPDDDGILILSEFAGAAEELHEALLVNPYDIDQIAARIKDAVTMSAEVRRDHMRDLRRRVHANNLENWSSSFLEALNEAIRARQAVAAA